MMSLESRLFYSLQSVMVYREHDAACEIGMTETCTCGLKQVADIARKDLDEYNALHPVTQL